MAFQRAADVGKLRAARKPSKVSASDDLLLCAASPCAKQVDPTSVAGWGALTGTAPTARFGWTTVAGWGGRAAVALIVTFG